MQKNLISALLIISLIINIGLMMKVSGLYHEMTAQKIETIQTLEMLAQKARERSDESSGHDHFRGSGRKSSSSFTGSRYKH